MVYVQTTFDLDGIGYSATLPTYRTVLRREHRLSESEDEHLRRCRACSEARPMIDWTIGHHGDRRAVVVEHNAVADLVGRPGATGMLVPMRFPEGDAGPSYTVQSLHDRDALVLALQNSSAPDYEEVFSPPGRRRRIERLGCGRGQDLPEGAAGGDGRLVRLLLLHHLRGGIAAVPSEAALPGGGPERLDGRCGRAHRPGAPVSAEGRDLRPKGRRTQELRPRVGPPVPRPQGRAGGRGGATAIPRPAGGRATV